MQNPFGAGPMPTTTTTSYFGYGDSTSPSRPATRDGSAVSSALGLLSGGLSKERKASFSRKSSLSGARRRSSVSTTGGIADAVMTDDSAPPALPDYALAAAVKITPRDGRDPVRSPISPDGAAPVSSVGRAVSGTAFMMPPPQTPSTATGVSPTQWRQSEAAMMHQQIIEAAQKRISTLNYLRKA